MASQPDSLILSPDGTKIPRATEHLNLITPVNAPPLTPEEAAKDRHTVTMVFEHEVLFTVSHGMKVRYPKGIHEVPQEWSTHWFLLNSGARPYNRPIAVGPVPTATASKAPARTAKK